MRDQTILIVDDERTVRSTIQAYLEKEGYNVITATDGTQALAEAQTHHPDLVVLDIMLPKMDGLEVLRRLRQESNVYVLMLTAKAEEVDKIIGLRMGADDYLTKPFSPRELVARVEAILRRGRVPEPDNETLNFHHVRIDVGARLVWADGSAVDLTPIEYDLLQALARHRGHVLSREQLIEQVWGYDYYGDERVVDVHIGRLRKKLELSADIDTPEVIATVRGVGYRFEDEPK
ncbi:MAG: response regulator transcription factor [Caldilineales bacterium]|nr:response regulator transcription factor [Caldilineales bacterium]